jgi:hyperosmotically inducible periplasmic protein
LGKHATATISLSALHGTAVAQNAVENIFSGGVMNVLLVIFLSSFVMVGCSKEQDRADQTGSKSSSSVAADNTAKNERDRNDATKTAGDQSENEADRKITQEVRKSIVDDDKLSTSAHNVKIITDDGQVTLRGPVKTEAEKKAIESKAKQVAGVKNVENQLEIATN